MQQIQKDNQTHAVIVGGGIAGLSTAYYLQQKAHQSGLPLTYTLVESEPALGGKIATVTRDGFTVEGGPDSFYTQKPEAARLCRELGLGDRLRGSNDERRKVYVLHGGRLRQLPDGVMLVVPTRFAPFALSPFISIPGKLRMGLDLLIPPRHGDDDESMADFIRRRLGQEALDKIAGPLMAGIHVADPETLSMKSAFPRFIAMEQKYGSLIKGMLIQKAQASGHKSQGNGHKAPLFMTLRGGLRGLVEALAAQLEGEVQLNTRVAGLERAAEGVHYRLHLGDGRTLDADAVILAVPSYVAADLLEPLHHALAQRLRAIRYVSSATVSLGFRRDEFEHPLDGSGFVVSAQDKSRLMACTWTSTKFQGSAPDDRVLLRVFVGGPRNEGLVGLSDEEMAGLVRDELHKVMGVRARPVLTCIYRWIQGNPQYDVGHLERVGEIETTAADALPGLYLTGSPYRGVGLPDCIKQGQETAEAVVARVRRASPQAEFVVN